MARGVASGMGGIGSPRASSGTTSIEDLLTRYSAGEAPTLPPLTYNPPTINLNSLREQQARLQRLADNPESDPSVQALLQGVQTSLSASHRAAQDAARGRAVATGSAGFRGAMSRAANQALSDKVLGMSAARSKIVGEAGMQARQLALQSERDILAAQAQADQIATQRAQLEQQNALALLQAEYNKRNALLQAGLTGRGQDLSQATTQRQLDLTERGLVRQEQEDALTRQLRELQLQEAQRMAYQQQQLVPRQVSLAQLQQRLQELQLQDQITTLQRANPTMAGVNKALQDAQLTPLTQRTSQLDALALAERMRDPRNRGVTRQGQTGTIAPLL